MLRRRSRSIKWLVPVVATLLIVGIFTAELPELVSLLDNTSNDFVTRKVSRGERAPTLTMASHGAVLPDTKPPGYERRAGFVATFVGPEAISSDLLVLHSVLRT